MSKHNVCNIRFANNILPTRKMPNLNSKKYEYMFVSNS